VQEETRKLFRDFKDETTRTPTAFEKLDKSFEVPGLVPVSRVFVASQLMVARWLFETFPSVLKRQILKLVETLPTRAGAKILAKQIVGKGVTAHPFAVAIASGIEAQKQEIDARYIESLIRDNCSTVRRDFNGLVLSRGKRTRLVRSVRSRHGTPKPVGRPPAPPAPPVPVETRKRAKRAKPAKQPKPTPPRDAVPSQPPPPGHSQPRTRAPKAFKEDDDEAAEPVMMFGERVEAVVQSTAAAIKKAADIARFQKGGDGFDSY
jgi:hypothetical protein